jgi:hypothetical protein
MGPASRRHEDGLYRVGTCSRRGFFCLCIQFNGLDKTYTPREFAGLARVFAMLGLDMDFCWGFFDKSEDF